MSEGLETRAAIRRGFVKGMLVAVALTAVNVAIEHTALGKRLGWYAYEELQRWVAPEESPIVVVDVTGLSTTKRANGFEVTSRPKLLGILRALASEGAAAIGVDIDLAPEEGEPLLPEDRRLFADLLALRDGAAGVPAVPVVVGVHRSLLEAGARLGEPRFESLAAHLLVYESRIPAVPTWVLVAGSSEPLWGLGPALVRARGDALPAESGTGHWLRRANVAEHAETAWLATSAMLVDTSPAPALARDRIRIGSFGDATDEALARKIRAVLESERAQGRDVRGKIVLIGAADPTDKRDNAFFVPGEERAYPGVYLHACAAHTILQGYLYRVTPMGRIVADLALALFVFGGIALVRLVYGGRRLRPPPEMRVFLVLLVVSVVLALVGGLVGVARFRLVWDGFVYIALAAVLHLFIEAWQHATPSSHTRAPLPETLAAKSTEPERSAQPLNTP